MWASASKAALSWASTHQGVICGPDALGQSVVQSTAEICTLPSETTEAEVGRRRALATFREAGERSLGLSRGRPTDGNKMPEALARAALRAAVRQRRSSMSTVADIWSFGEPLLHVAA